MKVKKEKFGKTGNKDIYLFGIENEKGMKISIINYGGIMTSLHAPDRNGISENIIFGFDDLKGYLNPHPYFGCIIGRFANRIAGGTFILDGIEYKLALNNGLNHLHGGVKGFDKTVWECEEYLSGNEAGVKLHYISRDMEEGYPGNLDVTVIYSLNEDNEISIKYSAFTDKKTHINMTQHNYYNLNGCRGDIKDHVMKIFASCYTPCKSALMPDGDISEVKGTVFDFTNAKKIGRDLAFLNFGYDHNYALDGKEGDLKKAAEVKDEVSGRRMEIFTTEPGIQFYSGNFLDGSLSGKDGIIYNRHSAFCLEPQHFPDSPNKHGFPSTILLPGQEYRQLSVYKFYAE